MAKKKVGIMGGTFNPIHNGHLILGQTAYEQFGLDEVLFMPNKKAYYKKLSRNVTDQQRCDMVKLAIENNDAFTFSDIEVNREGVTYTVETLRILTSQNPDHAYYFIMGADSLFHFDTWKEAGEIVKMATLLVATRDSMATFDIESQIEYLQSEFEDARIECLFSPSLEISSNQLRKRCREGKSIRYLVPDSVAFYIDEHDLYVQEKKDE
jgi:nicotinate-nucleotide adenylyltransferase